MRISDWSSDVCSSDLNYESPPPIVTEVPELEPAPKPQAPAVERPQAPQPEQLADADRLPPSPLYQCHTWDNQNYLGEDADPRSEQRREGKEGVGTFRSRGSRYHKQKKRNIYNH